MKFFIDKHKNMFSIGISYYREYAGMLTLMFDFGFMSFCIEFSKEEE